jgi:hypothetical protein
MSNPLTPIDDERDDETRGGLGVIAERPDAAAATDGAEETNATAEADEVKGAAGEEAEAAPAEPRRARSGVGLLALVLGALLLISVAINLKQSRDVANLETRSQEYQQALAAAVERIDSEAARADGAEQALDRVDLAVDVVNERVLGLQEALDQLREATVR